MPNIRAVHFLKDHLDRGFNATSGYDSLGKNLCESSGVKVGIPDKFLGTRPALADRPAMLACIRASGEAPSMTGPADEIAAGQSRFRASHADREQVIGALQAALVPRSADRS